MRRVVILLLATVILAGCGTVSESQLTRDWMRQSAFSDGHATLVGDVSTALHTLRDPSTSAPALHTICGVLLIDVESAHASLPTPDDQSTTLLDAAYSLLGGGANTCYTAGSSVKSRARAVSYLTDGMAQLSFAVIRLGVASAG